MRRDYEGWLRQQQYDNGTIVAQLHRSGRVEQHYGDLDQHYAGDRLEGVIRDLRYTGEDERRGKPNPSRIPFNGKPRTNLASYKNAVVLYRRFLDNMRGSGAELEASSAPATKQDISVALAPPDAPADVEDNGQRIGLERDMQAALRRAIHQLEPGLEITDDGAERSVDSGFIDITARDAEGRTVVIELKAGAAGQRAIAQILSYMGDIAAEDPEIPVRGILVASQFDAKSQAAARMAPALTLRKYSVQFAFSAPER